MVDKGIFCQEISVCSKSNNLHHAFLSNQCLMCDSQVCCWTAVKASPSPPIRSVCSPHTLVEVISSVGLLCAIDGRVNIIKIYFLLSIIVTVS